MLAMASETGAASSAEAFLAECVEFKRGHVPSGRFYPAFLTGALTREQLRRWAKEMYHFVQLGIPALTAWLAHAPTVVERESARLVARNLAGELGFLDEPDHRDLYLGFLAGLDVDEPEAKSHLPLASTIGAATTLCAFCRSSFEEGLGAFGLGMELQVPGRPNGAAMILAALDRYDIPDEALEFYRIHVAAEDEHGANAAASLAPFLQTAGQQTLVRNAFRWSVVAIAGMQTGFDAILDG
jgi:pyrroloquinoline quinone (PQQ) biosynthesis protein C